MEARCIQDSSSPTATDDRLPSQDSSEAAPPPLEHAAAGNGVRTEAPGRALVSTDHDAASTAYAGSAASVRSANGAVIGRTNKEANKEFQSSANGGGKKPIHSTATSSIPSPSRAADAPQPPATTPSDKASSTATFQVHNGANREVSVVDAADDAAAPGAHNSAANGAPHRAAHGAATSTANSRDAAAAKSGTGAPANSTANPGEAAPADLDTGAPAGGNQTAAAPIQGSERNINVNGSGGDSQSASDLPPRGWAQTSATDVVGADRQADAASDLPPKGWAQTLATDVVGDGRQTAANGLPHSRAEPATPIRQLSAQELQALSAAVAKMQAQPLQQGLQTQQQQPTQQQQWQMQQQQTRKQMQGAAYQFSKGFPVLPSQRPMSPAEQRQQLLQDSSRRTQNWLADVPTEFSEALSVLAFALFIDWLILGSMVRLCTLPFQLYLTFGMMRLCC